ILRPKGSNTTDCCACPAAATACRIGISPPARNAERSPERQTSDGSASKRARFKLMIPWIVGWTEYLDRLPLGKFVCAENKFINPFEEKLDPPGDPNMLELVKADCGLMKPGVPIQLTGPALNELKLVKPTGLVT